MTARCPVIIPVKGLRGAKQRLAGILNESARGELVLAMLADVLDTLRTVDSISAVHIVTPDADIAWFAEQNGAHVIAESGGNGLNAAVIQGCSARDIRAARRALILPGDVPLATAEEIAVVVEAGLRRDGRRVTLVPSRDGNGTNAMLLAPPDAIAPCYGLGSFVEHLAAAVARRIDTEVIELPGLASDIDMPADLARLLRVRRNVPRYAFLADHQSVQTRPGDYA